MNDDHSATATTADPAPATRRRFVRLGPFLAASAVRGLATGAGTAAGTWVVWWITHH